MSGEFGGFVIVAMVMVAIVAFKIVRAVRVARGTTQSRAKQEALFQSTFPELQPHFHPEKVLQFVNARRARKGSLIGSTWKSPPGFPAAAAAEIAADPKGEAVRLLDASGGVLGRFVFQEHAEGGVLRMGPGKLTVNLRDAAVRYWHPEREFKWSRAKGWRLLSALSDRPIDSNDRGTSFSSDSSSSSSSATTAAAAAAGAAVVVGAGGSFDGGGSSSSWDEGGSSSSAGEGGASDARTSY
jgi:uncharacterized membrane protein YgcG